jgi:hypothetical protein
LQGIYHRFRDVHRPIIHHQCPGYVLGDVAARIEACRYFCWKTAHYLDTTITTAT